MNHQDMSRFVPYFCSHVSFVYFTSLLLPENSQTNALGREQKSHVSRLEENLSWHAIGEVDFGSFAKGEGSGWTELRVPKGSPDFLEANVQQPSSFLLEWSERKTTKHAKESLRVIRSHSKELVSEPHLMEEMGKHKPCILPMHFEFIYKVQKCWEWILGNYPGTIPFPPLPFIWSHTEGNQKWKSAAWSHQEATDCSCWSTQCTLWNNILTKGAHVMEVVATL